MNPYVFTADPQVVYVTADPHVYELPTDKISHVFRVV